MCLSECITISTFYKPTFKECHTATSKIAQSIYRSNLSRCSLNDFAKVQQKMHIRKKISEKTRIIYKIQQWRQCISNNEDNQKGIRYMLTRILFERQFRSILTTIHVNSKKLLLLPKWMQHTALVGNTKESSFQQQVSSGT